MGKAKIGVDDIIGSAGIARNMDELAFIVAGSGGVCDGLNDACTFGERCGGLGGSALIPKEQGARANHQDQSNQYAFDRIAYALEPGAVGRFCEITIVKVGHVSLKICCVGSVSDHSIIEHS